MKYLTFDVFALFCVLSEYIYIGLNIKPECQ